MAREAGLQQVFSEIIKKNFPYTGKIRGSPIERTEQLLTKMMGSLTVSIPTLLKNTSTAT